MKVRKLWNSKLGGWALGSAVALGSVAPAGVSDLLSGGNPLVPCTGSHETLCVNANDPNDPCTTGDHMHSTCVPDLTTSGPFGHVLFGWGVSCPVGCAPQGGNACSINNTCYY